MSHRSWTEDQAFRVEFESGTFPPAGFNHRAPLRMGYVYLAEPDSETDYQLVREAKHNFLEHNAIDPVKYHDTMTRAWILAVRHFMDKTLASDSADSFIEQNPEMLDSKIMMTHYSAEVLFSDEARAQFVDPDLDPIPQHAG